MKLLKKIIGIIIISLFWIITLLFPVGNPIISLSILIIVTIAWIIYIVINRHNKKFVRRHLIFSPFAILAIIGILWAMISFASDKSGFFYSHTKYYDNCSGPHFNCIDPDYRIYYMDHRGFYYGPIVYYSWGVCYAFYFNDVALKAIVKIFGFPRNNHSGDMPAFEELKLLNSYNLDTVPIFEFHSESTVYGKLLFDSKEIPVRKSKNNSWYFTDLSEVTDIVPLQSTRNDSETPYTKAVLAWTKYYPLIVIPDPYMSEAREDFGGRLIMYDCFNQKYVAEMLIPDTAYYNMYNR